MNGIGMMIPNLVKILMVILSPLETTKQFGIAVILNLQFEYEDGEGGMWMKETLK